MVILGEVKGLKEIKMKVGENVVVVTHEDDSKEEISIPTGTTLTVVVDDHD